MRELWQRLPERLREYAVRVAIWLVMVGVGLVIGRLTGTKVEPVPFPVYVDVETLTPVYVQAEAPGWFGWVEPTQAERSAALAAIKENQGGLDPDFSKLAQAALAAVDADDPVFFWEAELKVLKKTLPVWRQGDIGSCVSHGVGRAVQDTILSEIAGGEPETWPGAEVAREPIYGGSRVQIGGGQIRGDGSINAWAVAWVQKYGVVFYQKYPSVDLSDGYSVSRCRDYGQRGCPKALEEEARKHPIKTAALVKNANEMWIAIGNGFACCIASQVGFDSKQIEGFCARRGSWAHSMDVAGRFLHPTKGKCFVVRNSWGDYLAGGDNWIAVVGRAGKVQLPPGCFAVTANEMDAVAAAGDSFALSGFVGFPRRKIDWFIIGPANPLYIAAVKRYNDGRKANAPEFALAP